MPPNYGTRQRQSQQKERAAQGHPNNKLTKDIGLSKLVVGGFNFSASGVYGTNGMFAAFAVGDPVVVTGSMYNTGYFTVTQIDAVNHAFLYLDPPPDIETGAPFTIRTP
jgi:hypothetical protein